MNAWQTIHAELRRRLVERQWPPGSFLPNETDLAKEFGCARATVNRAMRELVAAGLVERRRKAGTRVLKNPVRRATLTIPVIRREIEQRGARWHCRLLEQSKAVPPAVIAARLAIGAGQRALHVVSLHFADSQPFVLEDRWINLATVPEITQVDLAHISANEWLVENAPFTHGELSLSASSASAAQAAALDIEAEQALLIADRITYHLDQVVTCVRLAYAPGYRVNTTL